MRYFCFSLLFILLFSQCRQQEEYTTIEFSGKPEVPLSIKEDHEYLLGKIHKITLYQDSTGRAAVKLKDLLEHHFAEEEDFALTPLGILPLLATGEVPEESKEIIELCEKLKSELLHLTIEHQLIKAFMSEIIQVATIENHPEVIEFEKALQQHANIEEEVLSPTIILIGEYLQLKSLHNP